MRNPLSLKMLLTGHFQDIVFVLVFRSFFYDVSETRLLWIYPFGDFLSFYNRFMSFAKHETFPDLLVLFQSLGLCSLFPICFFLCVETDYFYWSIFKFTDSLLCDLHSDIRCTALFIFFGS